MSIERGGLMPCTEARKRANAAYNRRQDNIMIRPSKAEGARIRAAAAAAGLSVQRYILDTLRPHLPPDDADQADH
nr:MAG TPA: NikA, BACTERIAL CONJUGATION, RELAXASE, DNA [Caudoviricetes sp.]